MKITINIEGMHCKSCEMLIEDALEETQGIANASASHKDKTVKVSFNEKEISRDQIKSIIEKEGYKVK